MNAELLSRLLDAALALPETEREAFVLRSCGDDAELRRALETLLASYGTDDFLEQPVIRPDANEFAELDLFGDPSPARLGPYEILAKIGEGGMSRVFLGRRADGEPPSGEVAIKLLRIDLRHASKRFAREKSILERLDHPYLARLYETGMTPGRQPYFVMQYVDGIPITDHCDVSAVGIDERLRLFVEVCEAVHHAHQNLVVHRDLKPSNILIDSDGHPRLLDFGIAKWLEASAEATTAHTSTALVLTPSYAAPEHVAGKPVTTGTDVYSLGVLLYELLAGCLPHRWNGYSQAQILDRWRWEEATPPSRAVAGYEQDKAVEIARRRSLRPSSMIRRLQGDLDNVALRALRFEAHHRYDSALALAEDLQRHLDGRPVRARPATRGYRLKKLARRHAVLVGNVCLVVVVLLAIAVQSTLHARRLARERDRARQERAFAEQERSRADAAVDFIVDSFELADPVAGMGHDTNVIEILERAAQWAEDDLDREPATQAKILHTLGELHARLGLYEEAAERMGRARDIRLRLHGAEHPDALESTAALASIQQRLGDLDTAESTLRKVLAAQDGAPSAAATRRQLAELLGERGEYEEAESLARQALQQHRAGGSDLDREIALDLNVLMEIQYRSGDIRAAAATGRLALATSRQAFPPGSVVIAEDLGNLGAAEWSLGRFDRAEPLFAEALEMHRERLGAEHPAVATDLNNLAFLRLEVEDAISAEPLFRQAVAVLRAQFGDQHPRVAEARAGLGHALLLALRLDEAEEEFRAALRIHRAALGENAPLVAEHLHNLGTRFFLGDDPESAERYLQQALEIRLLRFGERGFRTGETYMMLARVDHRRGRLDSAERFYGLARESFAGNAGDTHWLVALVDLRLAELAVDRNHPIHGERLARQAMAALAGGLSPAHWRVAEARSVLGITLAAQGQPGPAERELLGAYRALCASRGDPSLPTREARRRLERLYESYPSLREARPDALATAGCRRAPAPDRSSLSG